MPKLKSNNDYISELKAVSPSISIIDKYVNSRTKITVRCDVCSYQWTARHTDLLRGHGCPRCSGKERKTTSRFREEVAMTNPNLEVVGEYVNTSTKIDVRCLDCGYTWKTNPSSLLSGIGCPACGGTKKKSQDEFIHALFSINPDIKVLEQYKNNSTKISVRCLRCGYEWRATPHNLIDARSRCPKCTHSSTSFIEQFIVEWLIRVLCSESVVHRDTTAIGLELDIFVPKL